MLQGKSVVDFYFFWRWQYIKRHKQCGLRIDFNPYEQQYRDNIKKFEREYSLNITPSRIIEGIISDKFVYYYPDCMSNESIIELDSSYLNDKGDRPIDYDDEGNPICENLTDYVENYCHLIAINKSTNIEIVLADIRCLFESDSRSREEAFIKSRNISIHDFQKENRDIVRAIGLWLWDRVKELGGKRGAIKQAIAELHKHNYLTQLGITEIEDTDIRFYRRRTEACVVAEEVLPFTKRGTKR
ncbi:hypothetical protein DFW101_0910 [Solidesulfovibrio carbinoliphilus subsp. oakridgensis]|uniref:Uncharacterized protein n=2 Tax=Solidesulfovibrio carbinoliphilus TaxID=345370 RepID=G7Q5Y9_9BACT|nr:hypothetical protein DFW101_0910 [Solidesulfovibrio carbinoliphilus subsp. oakridgensis]